MRMIDIITNKRNGKVLTNEEINYFVEQYTAGIIPDYQASALLMAIYFKGMNDQEIATLAGAMLHSGDVLDLSAIPGIKVDKHSTGGVGDKISIPLAPLVAAAGVKNPMISGRGLGHTGGTLDKLESIPGFKVDLSEDTFENQVAHVGTAIISATTKVAPADRKLYALRDVTATVDCIPLIASSIMSKKLASGTDALVLDVKTGSGAFMRDYGDARRLAQELVTIGKQHHTKCIALITNMDQPLGMTIGNTLEIEESIDILKGIGPADTTELTLELGSYMLLLAKIETNKEIARKILTEKIQDGSALAKFKELIVAQGGDSRVIEDYTLMPHAKNQIRIKSREDGYIKHIDANALGMVGVYLGGGRLAKEDQVDHGVGLVLNHKVGDFVNNGDTLATMYSNQEQNHDFIEQVLHAYQFTATPVDKDNLIFDVIE